MGAFNSGRSGIDRMWLAHVGSWWECEVCEGRWPKLDAGQGMRALPEVGVFYRLLYLVLEQIWQILVHTQTSCRAPRSCQQLSLHGAIPSLGSPWRDFLSDTWGRRGHNHRSPGLSLPCGEETGLADMMEPVLQDHAGWPSWSVEKFLKIPQGHVFILYCFLRTKYSKTLMPEKRALWLLYNWPCCKFKKKLVKRLEIMVTKISLLIVYCLAWVSLTLRCGGSGNLSWVTP